MRKQGNMNIVAMTAMLSVPIASCSASELVQFSCEVDNEYVSVIAISKSEIGEVKQKKYSVSIQQEGLAVRLPPMAYAVDWKDVKRILWTPMNDHPSTGRLEFYISRTDEHFTTEVIRNVQGACWQAIKHFVESNRLPVSMESKG